VCSITLAVPLTPASYLIKTKNKKKISQVIYEQREVKSRSEYQVAQRIDTERLQKYHKITAKML
jgi:hypothetical protein